MQGELRPSTQVPSLSLGYQTMSTRSDAPQHPRPTARRATSVRCRRPLAQSGHAVVRRVPFGGRPARPALGRPRSRRSPDPCRAGAGARGTDPSVAGLGRRRRASRLRRPRRPGAVGPPGRGRGGRVGGAARDRVDRHGVRQVARLPAAGPERGSRRTRPARTPRRRHALPRPDEGPGPRPAVVVARARPVDSCLDLRRRQQSRRARLGSRPRRVRADQPRHAAPLDPPRARALGRVPLLAALRRDRRVPLLPRRLRRARRPRAAPPAPGVRVVRRPPDVRARLRHHRRAGPDGLAHHRPRRRRGDRRRLAPW